MSEVFTDESQANIERLEAELSAKLGDGVPGSDTGMFGEPDFGYGPASRAEQRARWLKRDEDHAELLESDPSYREMWEQLERLRGGKRVSERARELVNAGVPAKDARAIADGALDETDALKAAHSASEDGSRILVLAGPPGVGKTTAAAWLASQGVRSGKLWVEKRGEEILFLTALGLARTSVYDDDAMRPIERTPLLVIDDVGAEYADAKGMFATILDGVVNERYAANRRTVITTNLNASSFKERYGERIADRIRECGRFVELAGESLRRKP